MSISYELAKELKDAGWPQKGEKWLTPEGYSVCNCYVCQNEGQQPNPNKDIVEPTLSELILEVYKYCHEYRLECVKDNPGVWAACTCWGNGYEDDWQRGPTPEEAVARLWLALQKHE